MTTLRQAGATPAAVAQRATEKGVLASGELTLIGLFGPARALSALVRSSSGRIHRVRAGQRLDGGRIAGIDADGVVLEKHGKTRRLAIPGT